ncbi:CocE/NonD family hydrolase C-terminal non-catalytic domain-containing protein [Paractinoplanes durhamensis]|uniref:CocE/NonD family hydrolase C-terminal non-catalytic domain-containing protein n=1 Tax=Paractinoplanes durhamensis TaxID=113563 RepID=UPI0019416DAA|nr:CocE/NonD family hydrolase C-terminal non-catalytic domain-containing protein [Actinoplanes durhamensis]
MAKLEGLHALQRLQPLTRSHPRPRSSDHGQIVAVEIDLFPLGISFRPGEQLRLVVSGRHLLGPMMPALREYTPANKGLHVIHTGGEHASYLQLPVQAG